ncbi:von Willebrand factor type A domain-containing protein [Reichenbachiella sp. MALMAid0571]|uniref:YfbK domain-containing protein n=1 Tax=Reichenbachiella sp. MALMAid0571 TaxID=3143939 RepID=UPI0032DF5F11
MKKLIGIALIVLLSGFKANHNASISVTGIVLDGKNNQPLANVAIAVKGTNIGTTTGKDGKFFLTSLQNEAVLIFNVVNYKEKIVAFNSKSSDIVVKMTSLKYEMQIDSMEFEIVQENVLVKPGIARAKTDKKYPGKSEMMMSSQATRHITVSDSYFSPPHNTEEYDFIQENIFHNPKNVPLSTFSIDVDAASYSNMRRSINSRQMPLKDMIRIEEMINYFNYNYPNPDGEHPFSITTEVAQAPWNPKHQLIHIGLQGKKLDYENTDPSNLVFLIDVSGSMSAQNKLPLLKSALKMLVNQLGHKDKIAIVAYAGAAGLVLAPTPASNREVIISALDNLKSGGPTAGGEGIKLAYKIAEENIVENGNNRVILATDGDFNVGVSSTSEMVRLIEEKRQSGIYLTITGFGMGNYKDGRMEQISNAGNGNYYYIDNLNEARKVFITEMKATLFTIAKDVKIQVEFNPDKVQAYRLIGYENRKLNAEDFNNDKKDAGELGAGHSVTALYEIIPQGIKSAFSRNIDPLKYKNETPNSHSNELLTVKFRYKKPNESASKLITHTLDSQTIDINKTSDNFRYAASVAEFGMLLRDSEFKQNASYQNVITLALGAKGEDKEGYRQEFINLVRNVEILDKEKI